MSRVYLGDGVYAERGPMGIELVTSDGETDTNRIVLEQVVFEALMRWVLKPAAFEAWVRAEKELSGGK